MHRLRIKYGKMGRLKFISHLDFICAIERSLRRASFPLVLTKGFNPRVKMSYGPPLSVGVSSESEYMDIFLNNHLSLKEVVDLLNMVLPDGLHIYRAKYVLLDEPSITKFVNFAEYQIEVAVPSLGVSDIKDRIEELFSKKEFKFVKKGKEKVLPTKQAVSRIEINYFELGKATINVLLSIGDLGSVRPEALMKSLFSRPDCDEDHVILNIHRIGLYAKIGDEFYSPIDTR